MTITARVFLSGRSQALRLLARLKLQAKEVRLEQIGKDIWLHPETLPEQDMGLWLQQFYADTEPLPAEFLADRQASHHYAHIRAALDRAGTPIGGMDLMIAAHAPAEDSVVITNNAREFHRVPGLAVGSVDERGLKPAS